MTPRDLDDHDCLTFTAHSPLISTIRRSRATATLQSGYEWRFRHDGRYITHQVPARMRANALDAVVEAAVAGAGLVYAPAWQVYDHVAAGRLKVVLRDYEVPPLPINAVLSHTRLLSNKVRALMEFLAAQLSSRDFSSLPSAGEI
jgi:DNA-binding transcriptional LysR family regulator